MSNREREVELRALHLEANSQISGIPVTSSMPSDSTWSVSLSEREYKLGSWIESALLVFAILYRSRKVQGFLFMLAVADISALLWEYFSGHFFIGKMLNLTVGTIFSVETLGRLWVLGRDEFFDDRENLLDFCVLISTIVEMFSFVIEVADTTGFREAAKFIRYFAKLSRFVRLARLIRRQISQNRQRYVDKQIDTDIDLSYIDPHLIAMSVPAVGITAVYRNPISEVARFLELKHKGKYRIYNFCPELPYPTRYFNAVVRRYDVQDHSPPSMEDIFNFLDDAADFRYAGLGISTLGRNVNESSDQESSNRESFGTPFFDDIGDDNVIAIHCKGGKGRTGTLCCAWLLYTRRCDSLDAALTLFADRRTDKAVQGKMQGVETKGQVRYLKYLEQWLVEKAVYHPTVIPPLPRPPDTTVKLNKLVLKQITVKRLAKLRSALNIRISNPSWHHGPGPVVAELDVPLDFILIQSSLNDQNVEICFTPEISVRGDFRIDVAASRWRFSQPIESTRKTFKPKPSKSNQRLLAGREEGLWIYAILHTAFVGTGPACVINACDLDRTKLQEKVRAARLNPNGSLVLGVQV